MLYFGVIFRNFILTFYFDKMMNFLDRNDDQFASHEPMILKFKKTSVIFVGCI